LALPALYSIPAAIDICRHTSAPVAVHHMKSFLVLVQQRVDERNRKSLVIGIFKLFSASMQNATNVIQRIIRIHGNHFSSIWFSTSDLSRSASSAIFNIWSVRNKIGDYRYALSNYADSKLKDMVEYFVYQRKPPADVSFAAVVQFEA
jgi:hypothetical protein